MRLIDADALTECFRKGKVTVINHVTDPIKRAVATIVFNWCDDKVNDEPTVDAVEVVHGRWEQCFEDWRKQIEGDKCSVCGFEHYGCSVKHYHYCPNCGAKMDGDVDDKP